MRGPFQVNDCLLSSSCVQCLGHEECSVYTGILCSHPMRNLSHPGPPPLTGGPFPTLYSSHLHRSTAPTPQRGLCTPTTPLSPAEVLLHPACYIQTGICCPPEWSPFPIPRTRFLFPCVHTLALSLGPLVPNSQGDSLLCPKPSFIPHMLPRGTSGMVSFSGESRYGNLVDFSGCLLLFFIIFSSPSWILNTLETGLCVYSVWIVLDNKVCSTDSGCLPFLVGQCYRNCFSQGGDGLLT